MTTVADVARLAGVSVSTVSYAMTGARPITTATRERVESAMRELGYTPNALARGLKSKRSRIIALLFPSRGRGLDLSSLDYVMGASDHAQQRGYHLLLWTTEADSLQELRQLSRMGLVDGALVMEVTVRDTRIRVLTEAAVPFATIGRTRRPDGMDYVDTDFAQCAAVAVQYLRDLGHHHLAFVNQATDGAESTLGPARRGRAEVQRAAHGSGMQVRAISCEPSFASGAEAFADMVRQDPRLSAVIAMNEQALPGLISAAIERGWQVPARCSFVGIALSHQAAAMTVPPTTTVGASGREMGRAAVDVLIRRIEGDDSSTRQELFPGRLMVRGTSGPAPAAW